MIQAVNKASIGGFTHTRELFTGSTPCKAACDELGEADALARDSGQQRRRTRAARRAGFSILL